MPYLGRVSTLRLISLLVYSLGIIGFGVAGVVLACGFPPEAGAARGAG